MLVFLIVIVLTLVSSASSRRRRRLEEERGRREAELLRSGGVPVSPFGATPFGMLFDSLFSGAGGWSRGYTLDPETGRGVEVTGYDRPEEQEEEPAPEPADDATREERRAAARRQRRNRAQ